MENIKQEKAVEEIVENSGNVNKAMRKAEYAPILGSVSKVRDEDIIINTYFPILSNRRNRGFFAALELTRRSRREIIDWGVYKIFGIWIKTKEKDDNYNTKRK
ncbi:MAG: hypothetical protein AABY15_05155 [Nanoarchaeota archaeon]